MALFGLFGKKDTTPPRPPVSAETYLEVHDAADLLNKGLEALDTDWDFDLRCPICLTVTRFGEPKIAAAPAFRAAMEKGDASAAFALGVMYEHGLSSETPMDPSQAALCYSFAQDHGCRLVPMLNFIRSHSPYGDLEYAVTPEERTANSMLAACDTDRRNRYATQVRVHLEREHGIELEKWEKEIFLQLSSYLLFFYAQKEYPLSVGRLLFYMENHKEQLSLKNFYHFMTFTSKDRTFQATCLGELLQSLVRRGDPRAIRTCNLLGARF